jgi:hypothetical protein
MVTKGNKMSYKQLKVKTETDNLIDSCINVYLSYHKNMIGIYISRNKIIYEMAQFYLKGEIITTPIKKERT